MSMFGKYETENPNSIREWNEALMLFPVKQGGLAF